jgi:hypothetical protein
MNNVENPQLKGGRPPSPLIWKGRVKPPDFGYFKVTPDTASTNQAWCRG